MLLTCPQMSVVGILLGSTAPTTSAHARLSGLTQQERGTRNGDTGAERSEDEV